MGDGAMRRFLDTCLPEKWRAMGDGGDLRPVPGGVQPWLVERNLNHWAKIPGFTTWNKLNPHGRKYYVLPLSGAKRQDKVIYLWVVNYEAI